MCAIPKARKRFRLKFMARRWGFTMFHFLSQWFTASNSKTIKNPRKAFYSKTLPKIEFLEDRTTPANITFASGVLTLDFTNTDSTSESVIVTNNGTTIDISGDANGSQLSFDIKDVNQIVVQDSGGGSAQSAKFTGSSGFNLSGGFASSGVDSIEINQEISSATSGISIETSQSLEVSAKLTSTTGDIVLKNTGSSLKNDAGIIITSSNAKISTLGGNIFIDGTGSGITNNLHGVAIDAGAKIFAGNDGATFGALSITGTGSKFASGDYNFGLWLEGTGTEINSSGGNVTLLGNGGGTGASAGNFGLVVTSGAVVSAGGTGAVSITGIGSAKVSGGGNMGLRVDGVGSLITSSGGSVTVTGTGGGSGADGYNHGILVANGAAILAGGSGTVSVSGQGSLSDTGSNNYGVLISSTSAKISSSGGAVSVTGTGGGSGAGNYNYGVKVSSSASISSGINGNVSVSGTGGGSSLSTIGFNLGVFLADSSSIKSSGTSTLSISGNGGLNSGGNYNHGVLIGVSNLVQAGSGGITISGNKTTGTTSYGIGMDQTTLVTTASTGGQISFSANGIYLGNTSKIETTGFASLHSSESISGTGLVVANNLTLAASSGISINTQTPTLASVSSTTGDIIIGQAGNLNLPSIIASGMLNIIVTGAISQQSGSSLSVNGISSFNAGTSIILESGSNNFVGAVALKNTGANNVSIKDSNSITIASSNVGSGTLNISAVGISQTGPIIQQASAGAVTLNAGAGTLALLNGSNDFTGIVSITNSNSFAVQVADANALQLGTVKTDGIISITALGSLSSSSLGSIENSAALNLTGATIGSVSQPILILNTAGLNATSTANGNIFLKAQTNTIQVASLNAGTGTITFEGGNFVSSANEIIHDNSSINLNGASWDLNNYTETVAAISGNSNIYLGSGSITISGSTLENYSGTISGSGNFIRSGTGSTSFLSANTYNGKTFVLGGSLILNANQTSDFIVDGGTLSGSATIGKLKAISGSVSPSLLQSNDLSLSALSSLNITIRGTTPGTGYDQIKSLGTVTLGNASLNLSGTFILPAGSELILVSNDGTDPISGTFKGISNNQIITIQGTSYLLKYDGGDGNDITLTRPNPQFITVGTISTPTGSGFEFFSSINPTPTKITAFQGFYGEIRVSSNSDFNGDGVNDIVAAAGPGGGPRVSIFSGANGNILLDFFAYNTSFSGGVFVATGDVTGDGVPDLITGAGATGGPHVIIWDGISLAHNSPTPKASFFAYSPTFLGGVSVATGDLNGDGIKEIITGAGIGGGPQVNVYSGGSFSLLHTFFAYDSHFAGGIFVAAGDLNGDRHAEIITGTGQGGTSKVNLFDGQNFQILGSFSPYQQGYNGPVSVGAADYFGIGKQNIITGAGNNIGQNPNVKIFAYDTTLLDSFFTANSSGFPNSVFIS